MHVTASIKHYNNIDDVNKLELLPKRTKKETRAILLSHGLNAEDRNTACKQNENYMNII